MGLLGAGLRRWAVLLVMGAWLLLVSPAIAAELPAFALQILSGQETGPAPQFSGYQLQEAGPSGGEYRMLWRPTPPASGDPVEIRLASRPPDAPAYALTPSFRVSFRLGAAPGGRPQATPAAVEQLAQAVTAAISRHDQGKLRWSEVVTPSAALHQTRYRPELQVDRQLALLTWALLAGSLLALAWVAAGALGRIRLLYLQYPQSGRILLALLALGTALRMAAPQRLVMAHMGHELLASARALGPPLKYGPAAQQWLHALDAAGLGSWPAVVAFNQLCAALQLPVLAGLLLRTGLSGAATASALAAVALAPVLLHDAASESILVPAMTLTLAAAWAWQHYLHTHKTLGLAAAFALGWAAMLARPELLALVPLTLAAVAVLARSHPIRLEDLSQNNSTRSLLLGGSQAHGHSVPLASSARALWDRGVLSPLRDSASRSTSFGTDPKPRLPLPPLAPALILSAFLLWLRLQQLAATVQAEQAVGNTPRAYAAWTLDRGLTLLGEALWLKNGLFWPELVPLALLPAWLAGLYAARGRDRKILLALLTLALAYLLPTPLDLPWLSVTRVQAPAMLWGLSAAGLGSWLWLEQKTRLSGQFPKRMAVAVAAVWLVSAAATVPELWRKDLATQEELALRAALATMPPGPARLLTRTHVDDPDERVHLGFAESLLDPAVRTGSLSELLRTAPADLGPEPTYVWLGSRCQLRSCERRGEHPACAAVRGQVALQPLWLGRLRHEPFELRPAFGPGRRDRHFASRDLDFPWCVANREFEVGLYRVTR